MRKAEESIGRNLVIKKTARKKILVWTTGGIMTMIILEFQVTTRNRLWYDAEMNLSWFQIRRSNLANINSLLTLSDEISLRGTKSRLNAILELMTLDRRIPLGLVVWCLELYDTAGYLAIDQRCKYFTCRITITFFASTFCTSAHFFHFLLVFSFFLRFSPCLSLENKYFFIFSF